MSIKSSTIYICIYLLFVIPLTVNTTKYAQKRVHINTHRGTHVELFVITEITIVDLCVIERRTITGLHLIKRHRVIKVDTQTDFALDCGLDSSSG